MNFEIFYSQEIIIAMSVSFAIGYVTFLILLYFLPKKLATENSSQKDILIQRAKLKKDQIIKESIKRAKEQLLGSKEEIETSLNDQILDLEAAQEELNSQERSLQQMEHRINRQERDLNNHKSKIKNLEKSYLKEKDSANLLIKELQHKLEAIAEVGTDTLKDDLTESLINERQLESQRYLKDLTENIDTHSKRIAYKFLNRSTSRYAPDLIWPKNQSYIEITQPKIIEAFQSPKNHGILNELRELSEGVEITLSQENEQTAIIKLGGGYGIYKEAARLTIEELLNKGSSQWARAARIYDKNKNTLEKLSFKMGRQAVSDLRLKGIHPELQKMVGALNWRSSYRQNQYYHSLEVATVAGILAQELSIDPELAKRCGLLHDIGKGIDYRIDGSHAVISGDYADRFGESKTICDTIMSHHNDLVIDTPLSHVLKTADTLSGARPGARVHLEEGYQIRLSAIDQAVKSFPGIAKVAIMSGGREVHIEVNPKKIREHEVENLTKEITKKIEADVAFPGQIKILVVRRFEAVAVA